ncbi:hypothetical protein BOTBODRAFT_48758 [Botryobasidium botryosum FD-172 SS1]|uniref:Dicer dsRNA-binding fold domain-containing protein n=1 Tax=Botryobasidium botryosum (strain FD-172 SS1) TaxID=930990 RepID=A0A067LYL6_BOTB1|nr:hypothetical protein BOTBODRAFT_48758 [Botryobasidium botryosum FD-172 SS1]
MVSLNPSAATACRHLLEGSSSSPPSHSEEVSNEVIAGGPSAKRPKLADASGDMLRFIQGPTTGSYIYARDASDALRKYSASPESGATLSTSSTPSGSLLCTAVLFPAHPAPHTVTGGAHSLAEDAKCDAAFEACLYLYNAGKLEDSYFPHQTTTLVALSRQAQAGLNNSQRQSTLYRTRDLSTDICFPSIFSVVEGNGSCQSSACVTPRPMPLVPQFWVEYQDLRFRLSVWRGKPFEVDSFRQQSMRDYTTELLRLASCSANFEPDEPNYSFVSMPANWTPSGDCESTLPSTLLEVQGVISWDEVERCCTDITGPHTTSTYAGGLNASKREHIYLKGRSFKPFGAGGRSGGHICAMVEAAYLFAPVMKYMDKMLTIKELNWRVLGGAYSDEFSRRALSTSFSKEGQELEFFGDSILNIHMGLCLAVTLPPNSSLRGARSTLHRLPTNATFVASALRCHLTEWIFDAPDDRGKNASRVPASIIDDKKARQFTKKQVADVVKSLVAAGYFSGGHALAFRAKDIIGIPIPEVVGSWASLATMAHLALPLQDAVADQWCVETVGYVEGIIGRTLQTPHVARQALVSSIVWVNLDWRLNPGPRPHPLSPFVGEVTYKFWYLIFVPVVTTRYLIHFSGSSNPGKLSKSLSRWFARIPQDEALNRRTLAALSVNAGLHERLWVGEADEDDRDEYIVVMQ